MREPGRMRVLTLAAGVPFPPTAGGLLRTHHLLRALAPRHELTLVGFTYDGGASPPPFPVRVVAVPWREPPLHRQMRSSDPQTARRAARALDHEDGEPYLASCFASEEMERALGGLGRERFDVVLVEGVYMARYLPLVPAGAAPVVDFLDVHTRMARRAVEEASEERREAAEREARRTLAFERRAVAGARLCLACSEADAAELRGALGAARVETVPNGVDTAHHRPAGGEADGSRLLFVGSMSHRPNVEAATWLAREVLPRVRRDLPDAVLDLVGSSPGEEVRRLASDAVVVHGRVADVRPYYRRAAVVVAPVLTGGGTRLKVLEAAASGKAIVTTPVGIDGLDLEPGRDLSVGETADELAAAVVALVRNPSLSAELGRRARLAALAYDWDGIGARFRALLEGLA